MELGPVTKIDKRNKTTSKKIVHDVNLANCDVIVTFPIYGQSGVLRKPDSGYILSKTYIFISNNFLSYKNWKQNWKIPNTALTLLLWVKVLLTLAKLSGTWYYKVYFLKLHMRVYLGIKFQVSRVTLTSFRHWGNFNPPPTPQNGPLKSPHSLRLKNYIRQG